MKRHIRSWSIAAIAVAAACGGDAFTSDGGSGGSGGNGSSSGSSSSGSGGSGGGSSSSSSSSSSGTGGCGSQSGECQTNDQCLEGDCVELTSCGFKVCERPLDEAVACNNPGIDECCESGDCAAGACYLGPWGAYCGGPQQEAYNMCAVDECQQDGDCPAPPPSMLVVCAPANTLGHPVRHCLLGSCRTNDDCNAEPGGHCAPVTQVCCSAPSSLLCVYPSDGCRSDGDCPDGYCQQDGDRARCFPGVYACPA